MKTLLLATLGAVVLAAGCGSDSKDPSTLCTSTGGTVATSSCCTSLDFPNNCTIGACSCPPTDSHSVKTCSCPTNKCFDASVGCK